MAPSLPNTPKTFSAAADELTEALNAVVAAAELHEPSQPRLYPIDAFSVDADVRRQYNEAARPTDSQIVVEKERLAKVEREILKLQGRLDNRNFVERAPAPVVAEVVARLDELASQKEEAQKQIDRCASRATYEEHLARERSEAVRERTKKHATIVQAIHDEQGVARPTCEVCGKQGTVGTKCCGAYMFP